MIGRTARGFTMVELIIAMAVVAILTAIALPAYTQYVQRSHRSDARLALMRAAQWMERYRTEWGSYRNATNPPVLPADVAVSPPPGSGKTQYNLSLASTATTFTLTAARNSTGTMKADSCGSLMLTHDGARGRTGTAPLEQCWAR